MGRSDRVNFMMPLSSYPSIGALAEFLTYLVVSQLVKRHLSGGWLTVEHLVESTHLWMHVNGHFIGLVQRVSLASRAKDLAARVANVSAGTFDAKTLGNAFLDHLNLNYRSQAVAEIYSNCVALLIHERFSVGDGRAPDDL
jgi:hypothetical protein